MPPKAHTYSGRAGFHFNTRNFLEIMYVLTHSQAWLWIFINGVPCFIFYDSLALGRWPLQLSFPPKKLFKQRCLDRKSPHPHTKGTGLRPCQLGFTSRNLDQVTDPSGKSLKFMNYENQNYIQIPMGNLRSPKSVSSPLKWSPAGLVLFSEAAKSTVLHMFVLSRLSSWTRYVALS